MIQIKDWIQQKETKELLEMLNKNVSSLLNYKFFRDPPRSIVMSKNYFLSPADGIILYAKIVENNNDKILDIKGEKYTLKELLQDNEYNQKSIVISIFMTAIDVHIVRISTSGIIKNIKYCDCIKTHNYSMLPLENDILEKLQINYDNLEYDFWNERKIFEIYNPYWKMNYYIVCIADKEVNMIIPFYEKNTSLTQGERIALVRWGSETVLVVPVKDNLNYNILAKELYHVEAGLDKVIKIEKK